jgi:hypothetical protein
LTEVEEQPPPVMAALRRAVEQLCAGRTDVTVEHNFVDDEEGSYGWNTILSPVGQGVRVWFWFDGFDQDLMLMVEDEYYFEWLDLTDEAAVVVDVLGICSAVLAGNLRVRRVRMQRHLDAWTPDGRQWTGPGQVHFPPWSRPLKAARDGKLPGYGPAKGA